MKKRYFILCFIHLLAAANVFAQSDIVISQYIETNSGTTPKGIEVFNVSGVPIDFSSQNLEIVLGRNGAACEDTLVSVNAGILQPNEVWVLGTTNLVDSATTYGVNLSGTTDFGFNFNGDDALQVILGGILQDQFGICGIDPGSSWSGSGVSTANQNIALADGICNGNLSGWTDPSTRFETVSTNPSGSGGMEGFGDAPAPCTSTCASPSDMVFDTPPASLTQSSPFSLELKLLCPDNSTSNCNDGTVTLTSTACGLEGTLTQPVVNGVANFSNLEIVRSPQDDVTFTASYSGGCGSLPSTSGSFDVLEPVPLTDEIRIRFVQLNSDGLDNFAFILLAPLEPNTTIHFTDNGWHGSSIYTNEGTISWTSPSTILACGTIIQISKDGITQNLTSGGAVGSTLSEGMFDFNQNEDQVLAYTGSVSSPTFIAALNNRNPWRNVIENDSEHSLLPPGLTNGIDAVALNHVDNQKVSVDLSGTADQIEAQINNLSNWTGNNTTQVSFSNSVDVENCGIPADPTPLPTADAGSDFTGCNGGPHNLSVGVTDAIGTVAYEWSPAASISGSTTGETASSNTTTTQTFTVTATDEDGCEATDEVTVNIPSGPAGTWTNNSGNDSWFDCRNWADGKVPDENTNVTVPTETSDPQVDDDAQNAFCEDLNLGNGRSIMLDGDPGLSLEVHGNISGSGSIQALIGHLIFGGSLPQTIASNVDITTWGLTIDKPENHLESQTDINVNCEAYPDTCDGVLLQSGVLKLSEGKKLIVGNGTAISVGSETSFVDGIIRKQGYEMDDEVIFPTGVLDLGGSGPGDNLLIYQPASLTASADDETAIFEVQYFHENYNELIIGADPFNPDLDTTLDKVSTCNYWDITRIGSLDVRVGLSWDEAYCHEIEDPTNLAVAYYYELAEVWGQTSTGSQPYNTVDPYTTGWVKTDGPVTSFSPFTIGSIGSDLNVLPIELLWFDAERLNHTVVKTNWATAAEINNDFFTVERSTDGIHFVEIGEVPGAGNSNSEINYRFDDDGASSTTTYYRLKQTDYDGAFTYSNVVAVGGTKDRGQLEITGVHNGESGLEVWHTRSQTPLTAEVFDLTGKRLLVKQVDGSSSRFVLHPQIARGIYFVRLSAEGEYDTAKFFY